MTTAVAEAADVGLLSRLEAGPVDIGTAAADCALTSRDAHALLECLTSLGLVATTDGTYRGAVGGIAELLRRRGGPRNTGARSRAPAAVTGRPARQQPRYVLSIFDRGP